MSKPRRRYKYEIRAANGKVLLLINDLYVAISEANAQNLELRKRLPDVKVGKRKFEHRFKVLRQITNQVDLFR